ncbi:hypothetical protein [Streptomyces sp. Je 1-369]|uniref:hypothetical protein n=1 Tax=Streptomyces sp. Je 1-369 TaxID=2966192 RepID=UPI0022865AA5|nr:hypothetical protein [Streptomyces sp. Je 1-369]WAL99744.1 hypothetical protein NOO62_37895 [Streptomyces sp. Je 1-369]
MTRLSDYDRHGRVWDLDPASGLLSPAPGGSCHGFVHLPGDGEQAAGALYGAGEDSGTLWLQFGARRWDCASASVRQASLPDGTRHFAVAGSGGDPEFELPYAAPDSHPFDPAYDWLDELADDFYLWVADRLATAASRQTLLEHFRAGFPAP